jgi:hypothetical protein
METVTGEQVAQAARKYLGVPFKLHGRDERGMDCVGLIVCVAKQFGLESDLKDYDRTGLPFANVERFLLSHGFASISLDCVAVGDIQTASADGKVTGVCIVSGTGANELAGITRAIHCDTIGTFPRLRVVEDSVTRSDIQQIKQALSSCGRSMSDVTAAFKVFRFPFVS